MLITPKILEKRLHLPATWLLAEAKNGRLPYVGEGDAILFDDETVERLLLERAREQPGVSGWEELAARARSLGLDEMYGADSAATDHTLACDAQLGNLSPAATRTLAWRMAQRAKGHSVMSRQTICPSCKAHQGQNLRPMADGQPAWTCGCGHQEPIDD